MKDVKGYFPLSGLATWHMHRKYGIVKEALRSLRKPGKLGETQGPLLRSKIFIWELRRALGSQTRKPFGEVEAKDRAYPFL